MGAPVPLDLAATAQAMYDVDGSAARVAQQLGMPARTVSDIVRGFGRWSELATDASYADLRRQQKRILQAACATNMSKALVRIEEKINDCSAPQAAMVFGILFDKDRLMAGESTQNVAIRDTQGAMALDTIADKLRGELVKRRK